jgi:hypothetical protein
MDIKWILIILGYVVGGIYIIYQIICNVRSLIVSVSAFTYCRAKNVFLPLRVKTKVYDESISI